MNPFKDKIAIVTGGASGIGYSLCRELCQRDAMVYAADLNADGLERLRQECSGGKLITSLLNVTDEAAVKALLDRAVDEQGRIDYLFNNAGIVVGGDFENMDFGKWKKIIDINLWGVIYGTQHAYAQMLQQGHGHIVNTASTAGITPVAKSTAYAATKHAVVGLSTSLREEGRKHGIHVSVAIPGLVDTNIFATATNLKGHDYEAAIRKVPIGKISPTQAARHILDGTARNQPYIVFPGINRLIVGLYRLLPGPMGWVMNRKTP